MCRSGSARGCRTRVLRTASDPGRGAEIQNSIQGLRLGEDPHALAIRGWGSCALPRFQFLPTFEKSASAYHGISCRFVCNYSRCGHRFFASYQLIILSLIKSSPRGRQVRQPAPLQNWGTPVSAVREKVEDRIEKRRRSPSVPFIGLEDATRRARELYDRAGRDWLSLADAARAWGRVAKSSASLQTLAALLGYRLVEDRHGAMPARSASASWQRASSHIPRPVPRPSNERSPRRRSSQN